MYQNTDKIFHRSPDRTSHRDKYLCFRKDGTSYLQNFPVQMAHHQMPGKQLWYGVVLHRFFSLFLRQTGTDILNHAALDYQTLESGSDTSHTDLPPCTDILLEFDLNSDGKPDKSISFGITCTDRANKVCWIQTLGNADNYIPATRIKGLYKLSAKEAEKYLYGYGVELRVIRKGTDVYVFLDGEEVAIWDLTQNNSGVTAKTPASLSVRHYDAPGDVTLDFEISDHVGEIKINRIFKENEKWDISNQYQGVVILPGGGTDTSLQFFKKYQNVDLTLTAKEHYTTEGAFGRTDVLFEFDLNNDGTMDKNVSFGIALKCLRIDSTVGLAYFRIRLHVVHTATNLYLVDPFGQ